MLRKCNRRFEGYFCPGRCIVKHKHHWLVARLYQLYRCANGTKIVRAWLGWHHNIIGNPDNVMNGRCDRWRGINHNHLNTGLAKVIKMTIEVLQVGLYKSRLFGFALVPPCGKTALRVGVNDSYRAISRQTGLNRKMTG